MTLGFVSKLLYGGVVTVTTCCFFNYVLEHVAEFTVVRKALYPCIKLKRTATCTFVSNTHGMIHSKELSSEASINQA